MRSRFAKQNGIVMDGQPMILRVSKRFVPEIALSESAIPRARISSIPPLAIAVPIREMFPELNRADITSPPEPKPPAEETSPKAPSVEFDRIRAVLDTCNNTDRKKPDPPGRDENIHQTFELLLEKNKLTPEQIDDILCFPPRFSRNFCKEVPDDRVPKKTLQKILSYFGLEKYLFVYKNSSLELINELKQNPAIDQYSLKPARVTTKEPFKLLKIVRGTDRDNNAYIYGLELVSGKREMKPVASCPFGLAIGKEYEIVGLTPIGDATKPEETLKNLKYRETEPKYQKNPK